MIAFSKLQFYDFYRGCYVRDVAKNAYTYAKNAKKRTVLAVLFLYVV